MTDENLAVLLDGRIVGSLRKIHPDRMSFRYEPAWQAFAKAMPLSLSLPLAVAEHEGPAVESFIRGLLPNAPTGEPFALIAHVGEDCAGAVQVVAPAKAQAMLSGPPAEAEWLTDGEVGERLQALKRDPAAGRLPKDTGQFCLAGAGAKTALFLQRDRWGVPSGRLPTTHILKPQGNASEGQAENEHFCLTLARALRFPAAASSIRRFGEETALVVERYDRVAQPDGDIVRVHQEDLCQALGSDPAPADIVKLLRKQSSRPQDDVETFVDSLVFNWLIGGTDADARNYSLLHGAGGRLRLAPLYDLSSALPYDRLDERKLEMRMEIGGERHLAGIGRRQWQKAESELGFESGQLQRRARARAQAMIWELPALTDRVHAGGLRHPVIARLSRVLKARATRCLEELTG